MPRGLAATVTFAGVVAIGIGVRTSDAAASSLAGRIGTFVTIFLGIFVEAAPFLLAGSFIASFLELFIGRETLVRLIPRNSAVAILVSSLLGLIFPVCECGVVPVARRLCQAGLPPSAAVAFLLTAPVVNPVVIASSYAAFGWGPMLWGRVGLSLVIGLAVAALFSFAKPEELLIPEVSSPQGSFSGPARRGSPARDIGLIVRILALTGEEFIEMARLLVAGSMLAAAMQTLIPQSAMLAIGKDPVVSVVALLSLAFVLSVCSTVDAFLALSFVGSFTQGSILGFLVFGPMVDIKSSVMFLSLFRRKTVLYLILLPLMMTMLAAMSIALNVSW